MNSPSLEAEIKPPIQLLALDLSLGTQTSKAYSAAVTMSPALSGLEVVITADRTAFYRGHSGLANSRVQLCGDPDYYQRVYIDGFAKDRFTEFHDLYSSKSLEVNIKEIIVWTLLHELGHGDDYSHYIAAAGGAYIEAYIKAERDRAEQLKTLPLGVPTSSAVALWDNNTNGTRDTLNDIGITEAVWPALIAENVDAYRKLPCEAVADQFALGVLATMHA